MAGITRPGLDGYQVRLTGVFAGKPPFVPSPKPFVDGTRFSLDAYMARPAGDFSGKPEFIPVEPGRPSGSFMRPVMREVTSGGP